MSELRGAVPALPRAVSTVATGITALALSAASKRAVIGGLLQVVHKANAVMPVVPVSTALGKAGTSLTEVRDRHGGAEVGRQDDPILLPSVKDTLD